MGIPTPKAKNQPHADHAQWIVALRTGRARLLHALLTQHPDWARHRFSELDDRTALAFAAKAGSDHLVALLLPFSDVHAVDARGKTPLMIAIEARRDECVRLLIPVSNLEHTDSIGKRPLHVAADRGHTAILKALLAAGAKLAPPDAHNHIDTPLIQAVRNRHEDCVGALLAWARQPGLRARTALMWATQGNWAPALNLLLQHSDALAVDDRGNTALIWALSANNTHAIAALLPLSPIAAVNHRGESALSYALANSNLDAMESLLPHSNTRLLDEQGNTLLLFASQGRRAPSLEAVQRMLPFVEIKAANQAGETALMRAAMLGRSDLVRVLLPLSEPRARDRQGRDAFACCFIQDENDKPITESQQDCADLLVHDQQDVSSLRFFLSLVAAHELPRTRAHLERLELRQELCGQDGALPPHAVALPEPLFGDALPTLKRGALRV